MLVIRARKYYHRDCIIHFQLFRYSQ